MVGGIVLAVAVICDCLVLGLWMRGLNSVASCLAAGCNLVGVVKLVGGTVFAVAVICDCLALGSVCGAQTRSSSCLAAGYNSNGVVKLVGGTVHASSFRNIRDKGGQIRINFCQAAWQGCDVS